MKTDPNQGGVAKIDIGELFPWEVGVGYGQLGEVIASYVDARTNNKFKNIARGA